MEDHSYNSLTYGTITIKARNKIYKDLSEANKEHLAAVVSGLGGSHQSKKMRGNPGDGYQGYVHDYGSNQLASYKDVEASPKSITVLRIGQVKAGFHAF